MAEGNAAGLPPAVDSLFPVPFLPWSLARGREMPASMGTCGCPLAFQNGLGRTRAWTRVGSP